MSPKPVYWKPRYATRSMRHRAWVRQEAAREQRLGSLPPRSVFRERIRAWLRRVV